MKKNNATIFSFLVIASCLLASCSGDVKKQLGMKRDGPDEFAVEKRPRLEVPPAFKLRPPAPGEAPLNAVETKDEALQKVLGTSGAPTATSSSGEKTLLGKLGVDKADSDIRKTLIQEYDSSQDKDVIDKIRSISDDNTNKTLVDAQKEKERIEENKKKDKPVTEGETPTKSINDGKSVIDKILD